MGNTAMDAARLSELERVVRSDIDAGRYFGAAIKVARGGETVLDLAVGTADQAGTQAIRTDTVFSVFSITKAFINVLVLRAVELGRLALTTPMVDIVPEFAGRPRDRATIFHFLTHTTGMPGVWEPVPGLLLEELDEAVAAVVAHVHGAVEPGSRCDYAPMAGHVLLGEVLRRIDPEGRPIGRILREDLWDPLGMTDTNLGILPHMRERHAVPEMRGVLPITSRSRTSPGDYGLYTAERNEAVWAGSASTTGDLQRFMEMLRRGGRAGEVRILSPRMIELARTVWTGTMPNELYRTVALRNGDAIPPAHLGLGFNVRGEGMFTTQLGTLTSPSTFGNYGAGTGLVWVDPVSDVSFVGLSAGLLTQADNIARYQRLSDMVAAAVV